MGDFVETERLGFCLNSTVRAALRPAVVNRALKVSALSGFHPRAFGLWPARSARAIL